MQNLDLDDVALILLSGEDLHLFEQTTSPAGSRVGSSGFPQRVLCSHYRHNRHQTFLQASP